VKKRIAKWVLVTGIGFAIVVFWLMRPVGGQGAGTSVNMVDIAEVRRYASKFSAESSNADFPAAVFVSHIQTVLWPDFLAKPSGGFSLLELDVFSYRLQFDDYFVLLEAVNDKARQEKVAPGGEHYSKPYNQMQQRLRKAKHIIVTHEHYDHSGGIAASPWFDEIASRVRLTSEQMNTPGSSMAGLGEEQKKQLVALEYDDMYVLAPGIVLIKAPGHTPGGQMVYVQLSSGQEMLFVGDIAWTRENLLLATSHPRLTSLLIGERADVMAGQLLMLRQLALDEPDLHIIVGHDGAYVRKLVKEKVLSQE